MLKGKSERSEFQKMLSSPHRKNKSEQKQKKEMLKKKRGNKEKWILKEKEIKWKMIFHEMILG